MINGVCIHHGLLNPVQAGGKFHPSFFKFFCLGQLTTLKCPQTFQGQKMERKNYTVGLIPRPRLLVHKKCPDKLPIKLIVSINKMFQKDSDFVNGIAH